MHFDGTDIIKTFRSISNNPQQHQPAARPLPRYNPTQTGLGDIERQMSRSAKGNVGNYLISAGDQIYLGTVRIKHPYARRIFYIDQQLWMPFYTLGYNRRGEFFKDEREIKDRGISVVVNLTERNVSPSFPRFRDYLLRLGKK